MPNLADLLDKLNIRIPFGRWQLFEFTDLWIVPPPVQTIKHDALSARWTNRIPILQPCSTAEVAADIVAACLNSLPDLKSSAWSIIDFGSGTGGPVPTIEKIVNQREPQRQNERATKPSTRREAIPFFLTDSNPNVNLDAWMLHASRSKNLSFVPQPVSAANPPFAVISTTTRGDKEAAFQQGFVDDGNKVFRLFCSTFHHFDDETAVRVLQSSMLTSDAFAIIETQERRVLSLICVLLDTCLFLFMAIFWFWNDRSLLFFTYCLPLLPLTQALDGAFSCLRTRTFDETIRLAQQAAAGSGKGSVTKNQHDGAVLIDNWEFRLHRVLHTWPIGYLTVISGRSLPP